jgi:hypothetical protein
MEPPERFELPTPSFVAKCSRPTELWRQKTEMTVKSSSPIKPRWIRTNSPRPPFDYLRRQALSSISDPVCKPLHLGTVPISLPASECVWKTKNGRRTRIRTLDPLVPNQVRYQTALHAVVKNLERSRRIELLALAWKAKVLPLYEPRTNLWSTP